MTDFKYIGNELELFSEAKNWKNYLQKLAKKYIQGDVLEVGAGIGANTHLFAQASYDNWLCLEPDTQLFEELETSIKANKINRCSAYNNTIDSLDSDESFDCILYVDVLEHIEQDQEEIIKAFNHLKNNGVLIIIGPAHQWLFTPFDESIGHFRRYNKKTFKMLLPEGIKTLKFYYLDSVGLFASLANKMLLKQSMPTLKQIKFWDTYIVPISKIFDPIIQYSFGKSMFFVGVKTN